MQPIQLIFNGLLVIFAGATIYFVIRQHKLEKTKIKLDVFPRRIDILDSIYNCILSIGSSPEKDIDNLCTLIHNTQNASFLFNEKDQIPEYITLLYKKGIDLAFKQKRLIQINDNKLKVIEEDRIKLINEIQEISMWFLSQNDIVKEKFKKYLQIVK